MRLGFLIILGAALIFQISCETLLAVGNDDDLDFASGRDEESLKTLRMVQFVHRNGIRNQRKIVLELSPLLQQSPPFEGYHQLTLAGKKEMFRLGQILRRRYDGFLKRAYSIDQILAQSKDIGRCIQSAEALLLGLFPEVEDDPGLDPKWNFVPVHTITREVDNIMDVNKDYNCPRLRQLDMEVQTSQVNSALLPKVYNYVNRRFNSTVSTLMQLFFLWQGWTTMAANGLEVPISESASEQINHLLTQIISAHSVKPEAQQLMFGPMFTQLMANVDNMLTFNGTWTPKDVQEDADPKLAYEYSTSSTQLIILLTVLKLPLYSIPPLASTVFLELHQQPGLDAEIRFFYKNMTGQPPFQLKSATCGSPCTVSNLKAKYAYLLNVTQNFTDRCVALSTSPPGADENTPI